MKKSLVFGLSLLFVLIFLFSLSLVSGLRINEIEANPEGDDAGNEWIEFYSKDKIELNDLKLIDSDGDEIALSLSFEGFYVFEFEKRWLDNKDNKLTLKQDSETLDETEGFNDNYNDGRSWQYCSGSWKFLSSSHDEKNSCPEEPETEEEESEEEAPEEESEEETEDETEEESKTTGKTIENEENDEEEQESEETIIELKPIKTKENIFKSKIQFIKENTIYAFTVFCVFLIIVLLIKIKKLR